MELERLATQSTNISDTTLQDTAIDGPGPAPKVYHYVNDANTTWASSLERKKSEVQTLLKMLEKRGKQRPGTKNTTSVITFEDAIRNGDFDSFRSAIQQVAHQFADRKVSILFSKYLYPGFDHLRSFSAGISSATQYEPTASLTWGLILIVIQCGCIFAESIEEILSALGEIQKLLPYLDKDLRRYPWSTDLRQSVRQIFDDYMDFCVLIIKNMARNPVSVVIRNFATSSLRQELKKLKAQLQSHVRDYDRAAENAERSRSIASDDAMLMLLTKQALPSTSRQSSITEIQFPIHSVDIEENLEFTGRETELEALYKLLVEDHKEPRPVSCTIHGIGGIGKTETALKFCYQFQQHFDAVFWVSADPEQETETLRTFGNIGRRLQLFDTDVLNDPQVDIVLEWLHTTERRWLIVFDNVEDRKHIVRYWPTRARKPSAIIVTSQKLTPWSNHQLDLEPLTDRAGSSFLLRQMHLSQLPDDDPLHDIAEEISRELGGSPLYLTHAQGFMTLSGSTPQDYLDSIRTRSNSLDWRSNSTWRYGRAASATHDRILQALTPGATDLLFMLAFMNPDEIKEELLLSHECNELEFLRDKQTYLSYIAELSEGRLVRRISDRALHRLRIHRATQAAMLQKLNNQIEQRDLAFNRVLQLVRDNFPDPSNMAKLHIAEAHVWPLITKVLPHLLSAFNCFERSWPIMTGGVFFAQLLSDIAGMDLYDRGRIAEAYKINKMVLKILNAVKYPWNSRLVADASAIIGMCSDFLALTKRQEGLEIRKQSVKIREHCFAEIPSKKATLNDKIWLYNSYTDLVCSQQQINDFEGARENLELCFKHYKTWGDEKKIPYEYSKYYNQMAYVLLYEGDSKKAVDYAKKGYELVEQATPGAQITVLYKFDYANILFQHGDADGALQMLLSMLKICKRDCGKDNVRTLEVRLNLGIVFYFIDDLDNAEKHIRKALNLNDTEQWPVENVIRGKYYLSQVLKKREPQNDNALALELEARNELEELLAAVDVSGQSADYRDNLPMLYDYLVHWECRLITPRKPISSRQLTGDLPLSQGLIWRVFYLLPFLLLLGVLKLYW